MSLKSYKTFYTVILIFLIIITFKYSFSNDTETSELRNHLNKYYEREKSGDWELAYKYRTPSFRKSVPFKTYKNIMERVSMGWQLIRIDVKTIRIEGNSAFIEVVFYEKCPEGFFPKFVKKKGIKMRELTHWEKINGRWYVRDPGTRDHLSLNIDLGN